ncbi:RNA polymerase sigma factor [Actinomadura sp. SCN-SB]|uniref:RNA polymerase sigma factor n=1 Tax=Actinomadura sp. SCN-SB TaxID=3373092 RepID=UPI003752DF41
MSAAPGPGQYDDSRLADALRAGDVIALTEVYDTYAPFLYDYCHGLLRDRVEAAGALRNTMIMAREHVGGLTEPERLRGWLYALARKECMRRRESPNRHTGQEAPEADDGDLTPEQLARRDERRALAHSALAALSGRQREAIDLAARHELDAVDLAGLFGIPPDEAEQLLEETHEDLGIALHAALIAQNHWEDCPSVSALTESWPLAPQAARSLIRHVDSCPTCGGRETPPLPADRLLAVLPIAAIPGDLRLDVLTAATAADRADNRHAIAAYAEPFTARGWPVPYKPAPARARERPEKRGGGRMFAALAGGAAAIALALVAMTAIGGAGAGENSGSADPDVPGTSGAPSAGGDPSDSLGPEPENPGSPTAPATSASPSKSPTPSESPTTESPTPTPSSSRPEPPPPGSLSVSGCSMGVSSSCTVRITAVGGPVSWRVTGTSGALSASGSGQLAAGESTGVRVSRTNGLCLGQRRGSVSFSPGGSASVSYC